MGNQRLTRLLSTIGRDSGVSSVGAASPGQREGINSDGVVAQRSHERLRAAEDVVWRTDLDVDVELKLHKNQWITFKFRMVVKYLSP